MKRKANKGVAIGLLFFLGVTGVLAGVFGLQANPSGKVIFFVVLSAVGGTIFGTSLSLIIDHLMGSDISDIRDYLFRSEKLESVPEFLNEVKGAWFVYYLTKENDNLCWKRCEYELEVSRNKSSLAGRYTTYDSDGEPRVYYVEGGVRGHTLILVSKAADGSEQESIEVIPRLRHTHLRHHVGVQVLETWDGDLAITYCIFSRTPVLGDRPDMDAASDFLSNMLNQQRLTCLFRPSAL